MDKALKNSTPGKVANIWWIELFQKNNRTDKIWKEANSFIFFSDVFTAIVVIFA